MHDLISTVGEELVQFPFLYEGVHNCPAVAIIPPNFPFSSSMFQCMEDSFGHRAFDSFLVPGFSSKLSKESRTVLAALDLAYKGHHIEEAVVFAHVDFHKQGFSTRFDTQIKEDCYHKGGLISSLRMLRKRYPKLNIRLVYARLVDDQKEIELSEIFECGRERIRLVTPYGFRGIFQCGAAIIICIDFRFRKETRIYVRNSLKIPTYDTIGIPGASKSFIDDARVSWKAIKVAYEQHGCRVFVIVHHQDCGAYGGSSFFSNPIEEEHYHRDQMISFERKIKEKYPDVSIIKVYARLVDGKKIQFVLC